MTNKKNKGFIVFLLILFIILATFGIKGFNLLKLKNEEKALEEKNRSLTMTRDELLLKYDSVRSREYIEGQARSKLKLVRPEEIIFIFDNTELEEDDENTN